MLRPLRRGEGLPPAKTTANGTDTDHPDTESTPESVNP
jgi:hypothetical protein